MVEAYSPYMAILVRLWLHAMGAVSLTLYVKVKYPTEGGVSELLGCQSVAKQCMFVVVWNQALEVSSSGSNPTLYQLMSNLSASSDEIAQCEGLDRIMIGDDKEMYFQIGTQLPPPKKDDLLNFLKGNLDVFAWSAYKAPGWTQNSYVII